jgi:poly(3-hydroxybutyrate) depolymerase
MNKVKTAIFAWLLIACLNGHAGAETLEKKSGSLTYQLYVPSTYTIAQRYPLIIAFHWSGGRGADMLQRWEEQAEKKGYIVACPDSKDADRWDPSEEEGIFRMISRIEKEYSVESSRIFLVGFSGGANFAYYLGLNHPDRFRAVAAFAGSLRKLGSSVRLSVVPHEQIPVFIIHGSKDEVVDMSEGEYSKKELQDAGYQVKFMELKGEKHDYPARVSWSIINWFDKV